MQRLVNALNQHSEDNISVFYINKEKAADFLRHAGNPISRAAQKLDGFTHSVTDKGSHVKMRIASVTESQQFMRWFGNWKKHPDKASKIVNADGTPKVVYYGSSDIFSIFSYGHIGSSSGVSILGDGFYFTDKKKLAKGYGQKVYGVYLWMTNPYYATEADAYRLNSKSLEEQGYDGVIMNTPSGTVFMVFNNTQIKSATDNIGTFDGGNPDIRYSIGSKTDGVVQTLLEKENDALREDVARLKELLKLQGRETHGIRFTASSVEAAARMLKKNAGAKGDTKALTKLLSGFYAYIATGKLTWDDVREKAKPIANWLMDHVEHGRSNYNKKIQIQSAPGA